MKVVNSSLTKLVICVSLFFVLFVPAVGAEVPADNLKIYVSFEEDLGQVEGEATLKAIQGVERITHRGILKKEGSTYFFEFNEAIDVSKTYNLATAYHLSNKGASIVNAYTNYKFSKTTPLMIPSIDKMNKTTIIKGNKDITIDSYLMKINDLDHFRLSNKTIYSQSKMAASFTFTNKGKKPFHLLNKKIQVGEDIFLDKLLEEAVSVKLDSPSRGSWIGNNEQDIQVSLQDDSILVTPGKYSFSVGKEYYWVKEMQIDKPTSIKFPSEPTSIYIEASASKGEYGTLIHTYTRLAAEGFFASISLNQHFTLLKDDKIVTEWDSRAMMDGKFLEKKIGNGEYVLRATYKNIQSEIKLQIGDGEAPLPGPAHGPTPTLGNPPAPASSVPVFRDVQAHWAASYIQKAAALGMIKGYEDGTFKPNAQLTRSQAVSLIVRGLGLETDEKSPFTDISKYAAETQAEIAAAYKYGIAKGNDGAFRPNDKVTRAQLALMIQRAYEAKTGKKYEASKVAPFNDFGGYNQETINAISMLHELKIVDGNNGQFLPTQPTTRAHIAKMLVNFIEGLEK